MLTPKTSRFTALGRCLSICVLSILSHILSAQDESGFVTQLDSFAVYGGKVKVLNGYTGTPYTQGNEVVQTIHETLPRIMGGLHYKLLQYENRHMQFRLKDASGFEEDLAALAKTFGIKGFNIDTQNWFSIEKIILDRLRAKPFFLIKELVIWDRDDLKLNLPSTKYSDHIRFNSERKEWERRVLTTWKVDNYNHQGQNNIIIKTQGLNLDTHTGFHIMKTHGLNAQLHPANFHEVPVSYPIIINTSKPAEEEILRIQNSLVHNLRILYDPFTWIARRDTRFRGTYASTLREYTDRKKYKVTDRKWFSSVLSKYLSDTVISKRHGTKEIYDFYVAQSFDSSPNGLGYGLDPLNWHSDEKREGKGPRGRDAKIWLGFNTPTGARFVLFDAYLRYGDKVTDILREKLLALEKPTDPKQLIKEVIAEASGVDADKYIKAAIKAQTQTIRTLLEKPRRF